jgi:glycine/D-amino acid oxidase-like deaminating enzyme
MVDGEAVAADAVVIAMGPWSDRARRWLSLPPIRGLKGHSLVYDTGAALPPEAVFLQYRHGEGDLSSPEIFPRPDGTTYVCAISSEPPLPEDAGDVTPDPGAIPRLRAMAAAIAPALAHHPIQAEQACFRPITPDGLPIIGAVPGAPGAFVATGHGPWGILNAPATGEAMAELIVDGAARGVSLAPFDPGRFAAA